MKFRAQHHNVGTTIRTICNVQICLQKVLLDRKVVGCSFNGVSNQETFNVKSRT